MRSAGLAVTLVALVMTGCSGEDDHTRQDPTRNAQTQAIEKARSAEEQIRQAFERRDQEMDRQSH